MKLAVLFFSLLSSAAIAQAIAKPAPAPPLKQAAPTLPTAACVAPSVQHTAALLSETAALLAGQSLPQALALQRAFASPAALAHQQSLQPSFQKLDERQLNKVKAFASKELSVSTQPLFYPFSGPDLLYAEAFFPQAKRYLLTGLEPVGDVPLLNQMSDAELAASFAELRKSLYAILNFSFFKTNDMRVDFRRNRLQGVVPVLLTFAGKIGFQVQSARFFYIDMQGRVCNTDAAALNVIKAPLIPGVALVLKKNAAEGSQELIYLSSDIGDTGLSKTPQYAAVVGELKQGATFIKSASFLLHKNYFSTIRQLILDTSPMLLQDDSGIPYKMIDKALWQPVFYGNYVKPIPLFAGHNQPDLGQAFKALGSTPLEFGIGYRYSKQDSSLLLFKRKTK